jgi:2-C-methyl-D-erythritol 4-phosphate cytidylyltransferase
MARFGVILPAAGRSARFGGIEKKPFVALDGRAVWLQTAELFFKRLDVCQTLIVISPEDRDLFEQRYRATLLFLENVQVVDGGSERFESVANALAKLDADVEYVAVHDAVRPCVTSALVDAVFAATVKHGAALPAVPVSDTVKRVEGDRVTETVSRQGLWLAQTPQAARRDWLEAAYASRHTLTDPVTDDAQLLEAAGHPVHIVPGSPFNLKITTRDDLDLARAVLRRHLQTEEPPASRRPFDDEEGWN